VNLLARQRPDMFRETYERSVWPADTLMWNGKPRVPERGEQKDVMERVIAVRQRNGLI